MRTILSCLVASLFVFTSAFAAGPASLVPWTAIEHRLVNDPTFNRMYVHPRAADRGADALEQLAASYGATRVFRHAYPGQSYLLFAYALHP